MALRHTPIQRPNYADRFQCIGPACEDTCCARWSIHLDKPTCNKFEALPESPLRAEILSQIQPLPPSTDGSASKAFAHFPLTKECACPFHGQDKLCRIQSTLGENYLPQICTNYPRIPSTIDNLEEKPLTLSCPEAARLILLDKNLLAPSTNGRYQFNWDDAKTAGEPITAWFWPIREFSLRLIANRNYALWQRLFLLALFTRRLDAVAHGEKNGDGKPLTFGKVFVEYESAIRFGSLRGAMEKIQPNLDLQLDMVLKLVEMRARQAFAHVRTTQLLKTFLDGIGYKPDAKFPNLTTQYADAYSRYFLPLMEQEPQILENFFINQIFRTLYPFGKEGLNGALKINGSSASSQDGSNPTASPLIRNLVQLVSYYTLIKGLLIGVAGFYRENFSVQHALATIQIASRHFEHQPVFIDLACLMLTQSGQDTPQGIAMLVRN
jgi:lysine-N-methylase